LTEGTCQNCGHAFVDNEDILVVGDGESWQAIKLATNWIKANVVGVVPYTQGTFTFAFHSALVGTATAVAVPVAHNVPGVDWVDGEAFIAYQRNNGNWQPIKGNWNYYIKVKGEAVGTITAADTTFEIDNVTVLQGDGPVLNAGKLVVENVAKIKLANDQVVEVRYNGALAQWETEPIVSHCVIGKAITTYNRTPTINIDNIELVCGSDPRVDPNDNTELLGLKNTFGLSVRVNGWVLAEKKANGDWIATVVDAIEEEMVHGFALIWKDIPGAVIAGSGASNGVWGSMEDAAILVDITSTGWSVRLDEDENAITVIGLWRGTQEFRASSTEQVLVSGWEITDPDTEQEEEEYTGVTHFLIDSEVDARMFPTYDFTKDMILGKAPNGLPKWFATGQCETTPSSDSDS
jgi:hypothetical protein